MPKEARKKVKDTHNNMKEKSQDHEYDHQTNGDPNP